MTRLSLKYLINDNNFKHKPCIVHCSRFVSEYYQHFEEKREWCKENNIEFDFIRGRYYFFSEDDAMKFKLAWAAT